MIRGLFTLLLLSATSVALAANVTVTTNPAGLQIIVDGTAYTAPRTFTWATGTEHTIAVASPQTSTGTRRVFSSWSDGGAITHTVTVGGTDVTYTANFTTLYLLVTGVSPGGTGAVTPAPLTMDGYYSAGTVVQLTAVPNTGYGFASWSGDLSGVVNPINVTMSAPRSITGNFATGVIITIDTSPPGLQVVVDGVTRTAPWTAAWAIGVQHTLSAPTPQTSGATRRIFASWSDGGALSHTITVPGSPATYTAAFVTQYLLSRTSSPSEGGTITASPASGDGYYDAGTVVQLTANAATDYAFVGWSGDAAGSINPTTVTMSGGRSVTAAFSRTSGMEEHPSGVPQAVDLFPNYPNPFNPSTTIRFQLPETREVRLEILDVLGRHIATLIEGKVEAGLHEVRMDASSIPSGVYVCRLKAGSSLRSRKILVLR